MRDHFMMMAAYNRWCNRRLYDAAQTVADDDYRADRGAYFGSLHGTLNHILVGDSIWMNRFSGEGPHPKSLDEILHEERAALRAAREAMDERIIGFIAALSPAVTERITYWTMSNPTQVTQNLSPALVHFFNHQTHHRGQAHCLLTQLTGDAPSFDLINYQREAGIS